MTERIAILEDATTFISGPAEYLAEKVAVAIAAVPQFALVFGPRIDAYNRIDYSTRELPALRIYNNTFIKEYESWFIHGELLLDIIFPPSLRREMEQKYQDVLVSALCQQFRRPTFFADMCAQVPGLNELGKEFSADKSLGFQRGTSEQTPLTQIRLNFRIDLRQWDLFLEGDERTKDTPFERILGRLEIVHTLIDGQRDDGNTEETVESQQTLQEE